MLVVFVGFVLFVFFFSSRRRHTRWPRDWSSDVCSSDLVGSFEPPCSLEPTSPSIIGFEGAMAPRSEERRVGKECRARWSTAQSKKKRSAGNEVTAWLKHAKSTSS